MSELGGLVFFSPHYCKYRHKCSALLLPEYVFKFCFFYMEILTVSASQPLSHNQMTEPEKKFAG